LTVIHLISFKTQWDIAS